MHSHASSTVVSHQSDETLAAASLLDPLGASTKPVNATHMHALTTHISLLQNHILSLTHQLTQFKLDMNELKLQAEHLQNENELLREENETLKFMQSISTTPTAETNVPKDDDGNRNNPNQENLPAPAKTLAQELDNDKPIHVEPNQPPPPATTRYRTTSSKRAVFKEKVQSLLDAADEAHQEHRSMSEEVRAFQSYITKIISSASSSSHPVPSVDIPIPSEASKIMSPTVTPQTFLQVMASTDPAALEEIGIVQPTSKRRNNRGITSKAEVSSTVGPDSAPHQMEILPTPSPVEPTWTFPKRLFY
ncbi:hypothetical protein BJ741DRAFT_589849 [Chytriomyces cf. hyalinus JEL632]|nr:hypothetical protein BJ741DRAFT_589849 [Chytriomyces cf. hyalinus JEL632]